MMPATIARAASAGDAFSSVSTSAIWVSIGPGYTSSQRALTFFDWVVEWAESKDFRGCPLQHTVSELTDAAHPARAIALGQREWFAERFLEWTKAAGVKDPKATARALVVLFDGAVAGSEVDGPQRASDARWMARKLLAG